MTKNPFIKAYYPHHGKWCRHFIPLTRMTNLHLALSLSSNLVDAGDQVGGDGCLVRNIRRSLVEYHGK